MTEHAALCSASVVFLGESSRYGLASVLVSQCQKCHSIFRCYTSTKLTHSNNTHYTTNVQAVLGQIATGGGAEHLEEQLACVQVPALTKVSFILLERTLGRVFEQVVEDNLLTAGKEERSLAIAQGTFHDGVPAITVVVDGGWSKRSHKHSYNAKSGVGVIFGAATKKLLFIGVRNKYCSVCAISDRNNSPCPSHQCFKNWNGSSCAMESDIIVQGFQLAEQMHGVRYRWFIGDGDSSVYHAVVTDVLYGRCVQKVECANHAVKCYRNRLEALCKEHPEYRGCHGLSGERMKKITRGARCAIKMHSTTGDVAALCHDLRNGVRHYFGDHTKCNSTYCKNTNTDTSNYCIIKYVCVYHYVHIGSSILSQLPPNFIHDVESAGDRLVAKASQLIQNKTTNITENFMSIR